MKYYLGIDGGGTRTTASVCDENGTIICKACGKTINFYSVGMDIARKNLSEIIADIYKNMGEVKFKSAFIGCSALDNRADDSITRALCDGIISSEKITMDSDTYVALHSDEAFASRGVVICGTGSMVAGLDESNKLYIKGGWGHVLGDGGSAYSIALAGLKEAVNLFDENKTDEPLVKKTQSFFNTTDIRKIIDIVYNENTTKDIIADFAKEVSCEAEKGDKASCDIITDECNKLLRTVYSLLGEMKHCEILYLYGGVFKNNILFRNHFINELNKKFTSVKVDLLTIPPDVGALKLAMKI